MFPRVLLVVYQVGGCCGLAPVVVVNGEVYGKLKKDDVAGIIEKYRKLG